MRNVFEVISIPRSGHHAFIEWFCSGRPTAIVFYNNLRPRSTPRSRAVEYYDPDRSDSVKIVGKQKFRFSAMGHQDDVIFNFERAYPENIERWNRRQFADNKDVRLHRLVFLRDPLNTFASAARFVDRRIFSSELNFYNQAFCFVETIHRLMKNQQSFCDEVILFTAWLTCPDYRRELGARLRTSSTETPHSVTAYGRGSSFDGMHFDPVADRSSLFERWQDMKDNPYFLSLFLDRDVRTAFLDYFNHFNEFERIGSGEIEIVYERAQKSEQATVFYQSLLQPLRRFLPQLKAMNRDEITFVRNLRRSFLRFRLRGVAGAYKEGRIV